MRRISGRTNSAARTVRQEKKARCRLRADHWRPGAPRGRHAAPRARYAAARASGTGSTAAAGCVGHGRGRGRRAVSVEPRRTRSSTAAGDRPHLRLRLAGEHTRHHAHAACARGAARAGVRRRAAQQSPRSSRTPVCRALRRTARCLARRARRRAARRRRRRLRRAARADAAAHGRRHHQRAASACPPTPSAAPYARHIATASAARARGCCARWSVCGALRAARLGMRVPGRTASVRALGVRAGCLRRARTPRLQLGIEHCRPRSACRLECSRVRGLEDAASIARPSAALNAPRRQRQGRLTATHRVETPAASPLSARAAWRRRHGESAASCNARAPACPRLPAASLAQLTHHHPRTRAALRRRACSGASRRSSWWRRAACSSAPARRPGSRPSSVRAPAGRMHLRARGCLRGVTLRSGVGARRRARGAAPRACGLRRFAGRLRAPATQRHARRG
jgi:hypothetical protein